MHVGMQNKNGINGGFVCLTAHILLYLQYKKKSIVKLSSFAAAATE